MKFTTKVRKSKLGKYANFPVSTLRLECGMKHLYSHWTLVKLQRPLGVFRGTTPIVLPHGIDGVEVEVRPEDALLKYSQAVGVM